MAFENVDLFDAVANASLERYGWQDRCEAKLIVLSENATYMVKNKETGEKEVHLLEQKGYERMVNEIVPVQQAEAYRKPTNKAVKEAVKELNPDTNSLGSRG